MAPGQLLGNGAADGVAHRRRQLLAGVADQGVGGARKDRREQLAQTHLEDDVDLPLQLGEHAPHHLRFVDL